MTPVQETRELPDELATPLRRLKFRCLFVSLFKGLGAGVLVFLLGVVLTGWLDLLIPLPGIVRFGVVLLLIAGLFAIGLSHLIVALRRSTPRRLAGLLDRAGGTGGQIRAAVELAEVSDGAPDSISGQLAKRAIADSVKLAESQPTESAQPIRPALKPFKLAFAVIVLLLVAWAVWPRLIQVQAARVFDPSGNHQPLSPYTFTIKKSADSVLFGDPFEVTVTVDGTRDRERFEWIVEQAGRQAWRFPLITRPDGTHSGTLSSVESDFKFTIVGVSGQSDTHAVKVINTPQIRESAVILEFPAYTGLAPYKGPIPEGGPSGVKGTKVRLLLGSNRPLSGGKIELSFAGATEKTPAIEMKPADSTQPNLVEGVFELTGDLSFAATIRDKDGLECKAPLQGRCLLVPDERPVVRLVEPRPRSFGTADVALPVVLEASDDFGIAEVQLLRSINGSRDVPISVPFDPKQRRALALELTLPFGDWSLEPGDTVSISAIVRDNDPAGAKSAQTPVHTVTIITNEQYLALLREQETIDDLEERYKPWLQRLVAMRREWQHAQEKKDPNGAKALKESLKEAIDEIEKQLKDPPVFSADLQFSRELRELQETLRKAQEDLERGDMQALDERLGNAQDEAEKDIGIPLETLVKVYRVIEDEQLYATLAQVQEDIARRTERFQNLKPDEKPDAEAQADMKALREEEEELRQVLQKLMQDLRDHAGKLPKDEEFKELAESADAFATQVHELGIDKALEDAAKALAGGRGAEGHQAAKDAAEKMMSLVQKAQGMAGQAGEGMKRRFGPSMPETINQMLQGKGLPQMGGNPGGGRGQRMGNSNNNTGVYGSKKKESKAGGGKSGKSQTGGGGPGSGTLDEVKGFGMLNDFDNGAANAVPLTILPSRYRTVIREFYQRVADETYKKR